MKTMLETPMQHALNVVESLDEDEQTILLDIVHQRRVARRRMEIAESARDTVLALKEGRARIGTLDELRRDLTGKS